MTHTYKINGMTCSNCENKVKSSLLLLPDVTQVDVSKENGTATIAMNKHIPITALQEVIGGINGKYQIEVTNHNEVLEQSRGWLQTYKPIILIFFYITFISSVVAWIYNLQFHYWMNLFMAQFFIAFSFFKMLDLKSFANSYAMYDVIARRWKTYGYVYPFIEFSLGIAYLIQYNPLITNIATILIMGVSSVGVIQSVIKKQRIQCACLGAVFNLPISTVTIMEDVLMVAMAASALILKI